MSPAGDAESGSRTSVLLVEGHAELLLAATELLNRWRDLVVVGAAEWDEHTLSRARQLEPQVVLMDLDRPNSTGLVGISLMRETVPQAGIVALSLSAETAFSHAAKLAGADEVVAKGNLTTDLLPAILEAANYHRD
jgi:DNA-binding NarL/FixJ family response regulator